MIFVFGSNESGRHGAGAARTARLEHGAVPGVGFGPTGNSFAIPTLDDRLKPIPLDRIKQYVDGFLDYALKNPELTFKVTRIGCGLAHRKDSDMAPLFLAAPGNCHFDTLWQPWLSDRKNYWGTF